MSLHTNCTIKKEEKKKMGNELQEGEFVDKEGHYADQKNE